MSQYPYEELTGGGDALDGIPFGGLSAINKAYGRGANYFRPYRYDPTNNNTTYPEFAPGIIIPNDNASGTGAWISSVLDFYPDASQPDQGAIVGNLATVKDIVDHVGTSVKATIVIKRDAYGSETDYIFLTDEVVPDNFTIKYENGVRLAPGTGITVTHNAGIIAFPTQHIFTGAGAITLGEGAVKEAYPKWWGALSDNSTDNQAAFTAWAASCNANGTKMSIPYGGAYKFSVGFAISKDFIRFELDGRLIYTGTTGSAITIGGGAGLADGIQGRISDLLIGAQDWDTETVGVMFAGARYANVDIRYIRNFTSNVQIGYVGSGTVFYNDIKIGRSEDSKRHLYFNGNEGEMNSNRFIGPRCVDTNNASHAQYSNSYGIYIPGASSSYVNGNTFTGQTFEWLNGSAKHITNDIYCGGKRNTFVGARLPDGATSGARVFFAVGSSGNIVTIPSGIDSIYDAGKNTIITGSLKRYDGYGIHTTTDFDSNFQTYFPGDIWANRNYDAQNDFPRKICITPGSFWSAITTTATTTAASAIVTLSVPGDIEVGTYIDIVGVTGSLLVTDRDFLAGTCTISPVADASVTTAAVAYTTPTFADETPASLRGTKTWDPPDTATGLKASTTVAVSGAALGDMVIAGPGEDALGVAPFGYVSAAGTVTFGFNNNTGGNVNLNETVWNVRVFKY